MRSSSKSEMHKTLVEATDYRRSRSRQYANNPTTRAGIATVKIITRSMLEVKSSASGGNIAFT
jgi:hypothetical protein